MDREQLASVCEALKIRIESRPTVAPTTEEWPEGSSHWVVVLHMGRRSIRTPYHMGPAFEGEPSVADVLSSLMIDASCGDQSFEDYCSDLGVNSDSRKEYASWEACHEIAPKVRRFLGKAYDRIANAEH